MIHVLIIVVLAGTQISAAHLDYSTAAECETHRAAVLHDPVQLGNGRKPIVIAVCKERETP